MAFKVNRSLLILFQIILVVIMHGCVAGNLNTVKRISPPPKDGIITAAPDDANFIETREYSIFSDEGDHLKELVAGRYYRKAARLYDMYKESYFKKTSTFSDKLREDEFRDELDEVALYLTTYFDKKINYEINKLPSIEKSLPVIKNWKNIKTILENSKKYIDEYNSFDLLHDQRYRKLDDKALLKKIHAYEDQLKKHADKAFLTYNFFSEKSFFDEYPAEIHNKKELIKKAHKCAVNKFSQADPDSIIMFHDVYSKYLDNEFKGILSGIFIEHYINVDSDKTSGSVLERIITASKKAKEKGFDLKNVKGLKLAFMEATSKTLLDEGYVEFPAEVDIDLPFEYKASSLENAFKDASDADYVIIFNVLHAEVKRRIKNKESKLSDFVAGFREEHNPEYRRAELNLREAENGLLTSKSELCYGNAWVVLACEIGKQARISEWNKKLSAARDDYVSTPPTKKVPMKQSYHFNVSNVDVTKLLTVNYYVLDRINKTYYKSLFDVSEKKSFKIAYNLKDEDTRKKEHLSLYSTENDIEEFEKKSVSVKLTNLLNDYLKNKEKSKMLVSEENLRAEMLKDKNIALAEYKRNKIETKALNDPRFNNVVVVYNPNGSIGSGFFVAPNLVLTNYHVVEGAKFVEMKMYNGLETFGKLVKNDIRLDLALIKVEAKGEPVEFYGKNKIDLGVGVEALGHPQGLEFSITRGVLSAVRKQKSVYDVGGKDILFMQTDAAINPGNSGGPLFYGDKVVGVNNQKIVANSVEGLGFAIHYSEVQSFLREDF